MTDNIIFSVENIQDVLYINEAEIGSALLGSGLTHGNYTPILDEVRGFIRSVQDGLLLRPSFYKIPIRGQILGKYGILIQKKDPRPPTDMKMVKPYNSVE